MCCRRRQCVKALGYGILASPTLWNTAMKISTPYHTPWYRDSSRCFILMYSFGWTLHCNLRKVWGRVTCFFDSLSSDDSRFTCRKVTLRPGDSTSCSHLRSNVHQKKGPSALHVRTNTCFTRCACVKERVKLIVEWKEMYYQWEVNIQSCGNRFQEIALSYKFVTTHTVFTQRRSGTYR